MKNIQSRVASMGLRTRLFLVIGVGVVAMVLVVGSLVLNNQRSLLKTMIIDGLQAAENVVASKLTGKAEQALGISMSVAGMPKIIQGAADQDRDAILETVVHVYQDVHSAFGVDVLHVRAPYDTSLVRGQNPNVYGDVQSRGGILDAGREGRPIFGFDRGPFGMGMRGWAPIKRGNTVVGTVETNIPFTEDFLQEIHQAAGIELAVYIPGDDGYQVLASTKGVGQISILSEIKVDTSLSHQIIQDWAYSFYRVTSYDGEELAVVAVFQNTAPYQKLIMGQTVQLLVLLVVGVALFSVILLYLVQRLLKPLRTLGQAADTIAAGNLTVDVPEVKSKDEVGILVSAFTGMVDSLKHMIGSLTAAVDEMSSASQQLASSTEQSRSSMLHVSDTAVSFAEAASALQDVHAAVQTISDVAHAGNTAVGHAVEGTVQLSETMGQLTDFIGALAQRSEEIGRIVEVINGIAEQTNLLALNAAIEAARAGEEGRGFAVVAEEVRKLAERSAVATREIGQLIAAIQSETKEAVDGMSQSAKQTAETTALVGQSGTALQRIMESVAGVTDLLTSASRSMEQLNSASQEISASAEEQFAVMDQVAEIAQTLNLMAERLQELSGRFTV